MHKNLIFALCRQKQLITMFCAWVVIAYAMGSGIWADEVIVDTRELAVVRPIMDEYAPVTREWVVRYPYAQKSFDLAVEIEALEVNLDEPDEEVQEIKIKPVVGMPVVESLLDGWFEQYGQEFGVSPTLLKRIAWCESTFRAEAVSTSGTYVGLFQFHARTWESNRRAMGVDPDPELRANPAESIRTAAFKMARDGVGAWPVCGARAVEK